MTAHSSPQLRSAHALDSLPGLPQAVVCRLQQQRTETAFEVSFQPAFSGESQLLRRLID
jgi:hypothetical protein